MFRIEIKEMEQEILVAGDMEQTVFEEFCTQLTSLLKCLIVSTDKIKLYSTRRTKCWTYFHAAQNDSIPQLWRTVYTALRLNRRGKHYLFTQSVTRKLFEQLMTAAFSDVLIKEKPREREEIMFTADELKILRYASGFVPYKLIKRYKTKSGEKFYHFKDCLQGMAVNSDENQDFLEYTKSWIDKVNRGGLFSVNNETFNLFIAVETSVRRLLPNHLIGSKSSSLQVLAQTVIEEIDVQFHWSLITQELSVTEEIELLQELIQLWITIRGFSFASSWLELYKEATKSNVQKSTGLRKHLS